MAGFKAPDFNERAAAARADKERALEKLRNKPAPDPAVLAEKQAAQAAREAAESERRAARKLAIEETKAAAEAAKIEAEEAKAAALAAEEEALAELKARTQKVQLTDAEKKAQRDARYAARKARKK